MLSFANNTSESTQSYSTADGNNFYIIIIGVFIAGSLSNVALITVISVAKTKIESEKGKKPKGYFHFWAFHLFICGFALYTYFNNSFNTTGATTTIFTTILFGLNAFSFVTTLFLPCFGINKIDLNTPTYCLFCQCCLKLCHYIVIMYSVGTIFSFVSSLIILIPNIIFVYYLYPTRTLIRLPLLINTVLYINTVLAVLIFQCERCWYPCNVNKKPSDIISNKTETRCSSLCKSCCEVLKNNHELPPFKKRIDDHNTFYSAYYKEIDYLKIYTYWIHPIATLLVLILLLLGIKIISDLIILHHQTSQDNQLELIITLVPTFLLLLGSWYKLDIFFIDEKEMSKKDLLAEILKELKKTNSGTEDDQSTGTHEILLLENEATQSREDNQSAGEHETIPMEDVQSTETSQSREDAPGRKQEDRDMGPQQPTRIRREEEPIKLIPFLDDESSAQPDEETGNQLTIQVAAPPNKTKAAKESITDNELTPLVK